MTKLPAVVSAESLVVRQQTEAAEIFTDFETRNRYEIQLADGRTVLYAAESGEGALAFLGRNFLGNRRPFDISIRGPGGNSELELRRPWTWLFSRLEVRDGHGQPLGTIQQRFALFAKRFTIHDPSGAEIAALHGPMLRPWTFRVLVDEQEVGKVTKEWSGLLKEAFTTADTFGVQFGPGMSPQVRSLALAATFLIDFLYFEHKE